MILFYLSRYLYNKRKWAILHFECRSKYLRTRFHRRTRNDLRLFLTAASSGVGPGLDTGRRRSPRNWRIAEARWSGRRTHHTHPVPVSASSSGVGVLLRLCQPRLPAPDSRLRNRAYHSARTIPPLTGRWPKRTSRRTSGWGRWDDRRPARPGDRSARPPGGRP